MNIKQNLTSAKNVVVANKTRILTVALVVTTTGAVIQRRALKLHDAFLEEKGLTDEYYNTPEIQ